MIKNNSFNLRLIVILSFAIYHLSLSHVVAQTRAGVTMGAAWNHYSIDNHYMTDWHYEGRWGVTLGLSGQYDVNEWLAVRADLNLTQKNHRQYRTGVLASTDYDTKNNYLQLPVMASFSFGGRTVRGFMNLGAYGGYWMSTRLKGEYTGIITESIITFDKSADFNSDRDQRLDGGLVGGIGVEYRFARHWAAQAETRCYYSLVSTQKDYMLLKDPKYNTTIGLQAAVYYLF